MTIRNDLDEYIFQANSVAEVVECLAVKLKGVSSNPVQGYNFSLFFATDERGFLSVKEIEPRIANTEPRIVLCDRSLRVFRALVFLLVAPWCRVFFHAVQL